MRNFHPFVLFALSGAYISILVTFCCFDKEQTLYAKFLLYAKRLVFPLHSYYRAVLKNEKKTQK
jgi:hypothetical protein